MPKPRNAHSKVAAATTFTDPADGIETQGIAGPCLSTNQGVKEALLRLRAVNPTLAAGLEARLRSANARPYDPPPEGHVSMERIARTVANMGGVSDWDHQHLKTCGHCQERRETWVSFLKEPKVARAVAKKSGAHLSTARLVQLRKRVSQATVTESQHIAQCSACAGHVHRSAFGVKDPLTELRRILEIFRREEKPTPEEESRQIG